MSSVASNSAVHLPFANKGVESGSDSIPNAGDGFHSSSTPTLPTITAEESSNVLVVYEEVQPRVEVSGKSLCDVAVENGSDQPQLRKAVLEFQNVALKGQRPTAAGIILYPPTRRWDSVQTLVENAADNSQQVGTSHSGFLHSTTLVSPQRWGSGVKDAPTGAAGASHTSSFQRTHLTTTTFPNMQKQPRRSTVIPVDPAMGCGFNASNTQRDGETALISLPVRQAYSSEQNSLGVLSSLPSAAATSMESQPTTTVSLSAPQLPASMAAQSSNGLERPPATEDDKGGVCHPPQHPAATTFVKVSIIEKSSASVNSTSNGNTDPSSKPMVTAAARRLNLVAASSMPRPSVQPQVATSQQVPVVAPSNNISRPLIALSIQLVALYKGINAQYYYRRRMETPGPKYNRGYDDKDGHYIVLLGEEIFNRYTVGEVLGKGSFGTVLRCYDQKRRETVALKITRCGTNFRNQAKLELSILLKLNENPHFNHLVVKLLKVFDWQEHLVLVFELLSFNLYQLIKCTRYNGVSLELVRKFAYQLVCALYELERQKPQPIIHCDLKPENILLQNQNRSGIRLIDFGSACYADKRIHHYIQSRFYRSPEVILYLNYGTAIDRWSLGCVLVELHTGRPLFDGRTEAGQLAHFEATLGPIPVDMLSASSKAYVFYNVNSHGVYQLKDPALPRRPLGSVIGVTTGGPNGTRKGTAGHDENAYREFFDFIFKLLQYRPQERISCHDALRHPFLAPLLRTEQSQQQAQGLVSRPSLPAQGSTTTETA